MLKPAGALSSFLHGKERMDDDRLIEPHRHEEDVPLENSLRPRRLTEFIGQNALKENLAVFITAAMQRHAAMRGEDQHARIELELIDAYRGAERQLSLRSARLEITESDLALIGRRETSALQAYERYAKARALIS